MNADFVLNYFLLNFSGDQETKSCRLNFLTNILASGGPQSQKAQKSTITIGIMVDF